MTGASADGRRCRRVLAVLVLAGVAVVAAAGTAWQLKRMEYAAAAGDYRADLARYRAELARRPELEAALRDAEETPGAGGLYLAGETPALAGAALQQRVRARIEDAGGELVSTQLVEGAQADGPLRPVVLRVHMRGDVGALLGTLHGLESGNPVLYVEELTVSASGTGKNPALSVRFALTGFLAPRPAPA